MRWSPVLVECVISLQSKCIRIERRATKCFDRWQSFHSRVDFNKRETALDVMGNYSLGPHDCAHLRNSQNRDIARCKSTFLVSVQNNTRRVMYIPDVINIVLELGNQRVKSYRKSIRISCFILYIYVRQAITRVSSDHIARTHFRRSHS